MLANIILRVGMALVFLWMGVDKLLNPDYWVQQLPLIGPYVTIIAGVQIIVGLLFLTRLYSLSALLGALMLGGAVVTLGYSPDAMRDVGLFFACVALLLPWEHHLTPQGIMRNYRDLVAGKKKH